MISYNIIKGDFFFFFPIGRTFLHHATVHNKANLLNIVALDKVKRK
jgi:hypothetical protein